MRLEASTYFLVDQIRNKYIRYIPIRFIVVGILLAIKCEQPSPSEVPVTFVPVRDADA